MSKWLFWVGLTALVGGVSAAVVIVLREARDPRGRVVAEERKGGDPSADRSVVERRIVIEHAPRPLDEAAPAADSTEEQPTTTADEAATEVEAMFESDRPATPQARAAEATIRETLLNPTMQGATLEALECRASTCRARITFTNEQTDVEVTRRLLLDPDSPLGARLEMGFMIPVRNTLDDGRVAATIYFYREQPVPGEAG